MVFIISVFFLLAKPENGSEDDDTSSTISSDTGSNNPIGDIVNMVTGESGRMERSQKSEMTLLDLYSGCGAMSTGLCIGASLSGVKLVTVCHLSIIHSNYFFTTTGF